MPNFSQSVFLLTSAVTFSVLYFIAQILVPGVFPRISLDVLLGRYTPTTKAGAEMSANNWVEFLEQNKLVGLLLTGLSAIVIGLWRSSGSKKRKPVLDTKEYNEFPLVEKVVISPNTALYRFGLSHSDDILGIPIGQHITVGAKIDGKMVSRSYTPTSSDDDPGHFDLVVKTYEKGNISRVLGNLKIGEKILVKGPKGQFRYTPGLVSEFGMIAGGTGITPMYQIITHILYNSKDRTKINLIYANVNKEDILLKLELDELAARNKDRFTIYYVLNNAPEGWKGGVGFVSKEMIQTYLPAYAEDKKTLICGPPPMVNAMKKHLEELNYPPAQTISKLHDAVFVF